MNFSKFLQEKDGQRIRHVKRVDEEVSAPPHPAHAPPVPDACRVPERRPSSGCNARGKSGTWRKS